jgi:protein-L-isoaspartate(D-aspartate) O-methyltransferase
MSSYEEQRKKLIIHLQNAGYIKSDPVKEAMEHIPREIFIPPEIRSKAYDDSPLPILHGQTISAPHMNAMMCELLALNPGEKVLEIGTGSGYHAALLGYIVSRENKSGSVHTVERIEELVKFAQDNLEKVKMNPFVKVIHGDGTLGYPQAAPYDKILVTAAGPKVPSPLINQLIEGGKLCIPIGNKKWSQSLKLITKRADFLEEKSISSVMFVPLIGKHGFDD